MKINEAIETLEEDFREQHPYTPDRHSQAKLLGIEALKRHRDTRFNSHNIIYIPLPGETEK